MKIFLRILIGLFFIISGISKLSSMEGFELYIYSFGLASFDLCSYFARLLIAAETAIGLCLVFRTFYREARWLTLLSLLGFSVFLVWRMALGDSESCHCMGELVDMNPLQSLVKNLVLIGIVAFLWKDRPAEGRFRFMKFVSRHEAVFTLAFLLVPLAAAFAVNPPDAFLRAGRNSHDLVYEKFKPVADSLGLSKGRKMVCFYSATCEHCRRCASKVSSILTRHGIPDENVSVMFMQTSSKQDSVVVAFFNENAGGKQLPYRYLHPYYYLPLTNGAMPLVVLLEDGAVRKEYDYISLNEKEIAEFFSRK